MVSISFPKAPNEFFMIYFYLLFENHIDIKMWETKKTQDKLNTDWEFTDHSSIYFGGR